MALDKSIVETVLPLLSEKSVVDGQLKRLEEERASFSNRFLHTGKDGPRCFGEPLPRPLQFSPLDFIPLSDSVALFGSGLATNEAAFLHLLTTGRFPRSITRVALVRDLFDRSPQRRHLSSIVRFVQSKEGIKYCFMDEAVIKMEHDAPRLVCEFARNQRDVFVQTTNNVPLMAYIAQLGLKVVPVASAHVDKEGCVPIWNYFNEAILTPNASLAKELEALLKTTPVKLYDCDGKHFLSVPFFCVGMNTNILSIDEVEVTASDIPLLYNHRTSVVESAVKKEFLSQTTNTIMMIAPIGFQRNPETALDNYFMHKTDSKEAEIERAALDEFRQIYLKFVRSGVNVIVKSAEVFHNTPDAVFPNNWFSTHPQNELGSSTVAFYPMKAPSRRAERRYEIASELQRVYSREINLMLWENANVAQYLEGTGVLIFDRLRKMAYASLSERCSENVAREWAQRAGYDVYLFKAFDSQRKSIYHTNVMMSVGSSVAVVCFESIHQEHEREGLRRHLAATHAIVNISLAQVNEMCGNVLEIRGSDNRRLLAMSSRAFNGFTVSQRAELLKHVDEIVHSPIPTIENIGGGSLRCMMAEIF